MTGLNEMIETFDYYRANPTTMNGHKILQMIKSGELQKVLLSAQREIDQVEYDKTFNSPDSRSQMIIDKYEQIMNIVLADCQPRG